VVHADQQVQTYQQLHQQTPCEILGDLDEEQMERLRPKLVTIELLGG
jgi:hypothetical protein